MPEKTLTRISTKELNNLRMGTNKVLVRIEEFNEGRAIESGIILGHNTEKLYSEGEGSHVADMAEIKGIVYRTPEVLFFKRGHRFTMPWYTPVELRIGDEVWFDYLSGLNCDELEVSGRVLKILPYQDLYVGKRDSNIFPLNGYCLFSQIKREKTSDLDIKPLREEYDYTRWIVEYTGIPNKVYDNMNISDDIELAVGDMAYFAKHFARNPIFLERFAPFANMDGKMYLRCQRRDVACVVKK